jgi:hypothetical protein
MGRGDEIDIVAADFLEMKHHLSQVLDAVGFPVAFLADFPVYAEDTPETTIGEKNRSGTPLPNKWSFFSEMRVIRRNHELVGCTAEAPFPSKPVCPALTGTECAIVHHIPEFFAFFLQFAVSMEFQICRFKIRCIFPASGG